MFVGDVFGNCGGRGPSAFRLTLPTTESFETSSGFSNVSVKTGCGLTTSSVSFAESFPACAHSDATIRKTALADPKAIALPQRARLCIVGFRTQRCKDE